MTWVRRQADEHRHLCDTPKGEGTPGDLWRCDTCKALWQLWRGELRYGYPERNFWTPATLWQCIRYWTHGRRSDVGGYQPVGDIEADPPDIEGPPRQTGADWLYSVPEKNAR